MGYFDGIVKFVFFSAFLKKAEVGACGDQVETFSGRFWV